MGKRRGSDYLDIDSWEVRRICQPFKLFKISNVFKIGYIRKLKKLLRSSKLFEKNATDIFSFSRLDNLELVESKEVRMFFELLKVLRICVSSQLKIKLDGNITISSSKYKKGDYLLCHDDQYGDRSVAFVIYLNKDWLQEFGGSLDLFNVDANGQPSSICAKVFPEFNSFLFFKVGSRTFHQVSEVKGKEPRITINGWFHAANKTKFQPSVSLQPGYNYQRVENVANLKLMLNSLFLNPKYTAPIEKQIRNNETFMSPDFLKADLYRKLEEELRSPNINWQIQGPANIKNYMKAEVTSLPKGMTLLLKAFTSRSMSKYLEDLTGLGIGCRVFIEVQKWDRGFYSLLSNNPELEDDRTLDVYLFFNVRNKSCKAHEVASGSTFYVEESATDVKHEIEAANNSICFVARSQPVPKFVNYLRHCCSSRYHVIFARPVSHLAHIRSGHSLAKTHLLRSFAKCNTWGLFYESTSLQVYRL